MAASNACRSEASRPVDQVAPRRMSCGETQVKPCLIFARTPAPTRRTPSVILCTSSALRPEERPLRSCARTGAREARRRCTRVSSAGARAGALRRWARCVAAGPRRARCVAARPRRARDAAARALAARTLATVVSSSRKDWMASSCSSAASASPRWKRCVCSCSGASPAANLRAKHRSAQRSQARERHGARSPHFWLYADTLFPVDVSACLISAMRAAESAMGSGAELELWLK